MLTRIYQHADDGSELCFYIDSQGKLSGKELSRLQWLIAETYRSENTRMESALIPGSFVEIGPRLNVETPFSSNAVAIAHAMGITKVRRIEHSVRYVLSESQDETTILADHLAATGTN